MVEAGGVVEAGVVEAGDAVKVLLAANQLLCLLPLTFFYTYRRIWVNLDSRSELRLGTSF